MATPTSIARYEILNRIGRGGMGALYLARDPKIDRLVAIKVLHADLDRDDMRIRFDREARSAGALNHPNIVTIFDYGVFEDAPYIVMEYLRGETLSELIRRRAPMPLGDKLSLLEQLCRGLAYAHDAGIIHRDIKPANLMVDQHGVLKILDFGIARLAESGLTQMSTTIGTPGYMSPEQIDGRHIERTSDVFAVGAVAYELLTYKPAFAGDSQNAIIYNVLHTAPEPIAAAAPDVGPEVVAIVERCLQKAAADRYADAVSVQRALQAAREGLGGTLKTPARLTPLANRPPTGAEANPSETPTSLARPTPWVRPPTGPNLIDSARVAFSGGDTSRAMALIDRLLAAEPQNPDAVALQKQIEDARVEELLSKARAGLVGQRYTEASDLVSRALKLRPASDLAQQLRAEVEARRVEAEKKLGGRARAKAAIDRGRQYIEQGAWDAARRAADEAWALDPQNEEVVALMQAADAGAQGSTGAGALFSNGEIIGAELMAATVPMSTSMPRPATPKPGSGTMPGVRPATGQATLPGLGTGQTAVAAPRRGLWILLAAGGTIALGVTAVMILNRPKPDTTPPVASIISPIENTPVNGNVTINVSASDNVGVAGVVVKVDGAQVGAELTSPPYQVNWPSSAVPDARHEISVEARDAAGNKAPAVRVFVTTQNAPPPVAQTVPQAPKPQGAPAVTKGPAEDPVARQQELTTLIAKIRDLSLDFKWAEVLKEANEGLKKFPGDSTLTAYRKAAITNGGGGWPD